MDTVYYTLYTEEAAVTADEAKASGGDSRQTASLRQPVPPKLPYRENNVISLDEYRAHLAAREDESWAQDWEEPAGAPAPRPRTDHSKERFPLLEAAASAALIAVSLAACAAFLL